MADSSVNLDRLQIVVEAESNKAASNIRSLASALNALRVACGNDGAGLKAVNSELVKMSRYSAKNLTKAFEALANKVEDVNDEVKKTEATMEKVGSLIVSSTGAVESLHTAIVPVNIIIEKIRENIEIAANKFYLMVKSANAIVPMKTWTSPLPDYPGIGQSPAIGMDFKSIVPMDTWYEKIKETNSVMDTLKLSAPVDEATRSLKDLDKEFKQKPKDAKGAAKSIKEVSKASKEIMDADWEKVSPLKSLFASIGRIALYRAIRTVLKEVVQALKEGLSMAYQWSKTNGFRLAEDLDQIASATKKMKAQLGAMVGEMITTLKPLLIFFVNVITKIAEIITQIFAALNGQTTYLKAKDMSALWEEATNSVKEYKQQLLGIDELNNLTTGDTKVDDTDLFEEKEISKLFKPLADFSLNFKKLIFGWDDGTDPDAMALEAMAGLFGAVTGFTIGGVPGAIIGTLVGLTLGMNFKDLEPFKYLGKGKKSAIFNAVSGLFGAGVGFILGGVPGALVGTLSSVALSIVFNDLKDWKLSGKGITDGLGKAVNGLFGAVAGFAIAGPIGALVGSLTGVALKIKFNQLTDWAFKSKTKKTMVNNMLTNLFAASCGFILAGPVGALVGTASSIALQLIFSKVDGWELRIKAIETVVGAALAGLFGAKIGFMLAGPLGAMVGTILAVTLAIVFTKFKPKSDIKSNDVTKGMKDVLEDISEGNGITVNQSSKDFTLDVDTDVLYSVKHVVPKAAPGVNINTNDFLDDVSDATGQMVKGVRFNTNKERIDLGIDVNIDYQIQKIKLNIGNGCVVEGIEGISEKVTDTVNAPTAPVTTNPVTSNEHSGTIDLTGGVKRKVDKQLPSVAGGSAISYGDNPIRRYDYNDANGIKRSKEIDMTTILGLSLVALAAGVATGGVATAIGAGAASTIAAATGLEISASTMMMSIGEIAAALAISTTAVREIVNQIRDEAFNGDNNIEQRASGGFVGRGTLFYAGEAGPEFVGSMGGNTAVANTEQMTEAIFKASYMGMSKALAENGLGNLEPASADDVYFAIKKVNNRQAKMTGGLAW